MMQFVFGMAVLIAVIDGSWLLALVIAWIWYEYETRATRDDD